MTFARCLTILGITAVLLSGIANAQSPAAPGPTLVSATPAGASGDGASFTNAFTAAGLGRQVTVSADGRYVVFQSSANNLVANLDTNAGSDVFRRDLLVGQTELVSVTPAGSAGNGTSRNATISADGRYVSFVSAAGDLAPLDTNGAGDVFVRDMQEHKTVLASALPSGSSAAGPSDQAALTPDGRYVVFVSKAGDLDLNAPDSNGTWDVYVRDLRAPPATAVRLASLDPAGRAGGAATEEVPGISDDGQVVAFYGANPLLPNDGNDAADVYVRDFRLGVTELISVTPAGEAGDSDSRFPVLSADGRYVAFVSRAADLTSVPDLNGRFGEDVFVRDRTSRTTRLVSINAAGTATGNGSTLGHAPALSADGRYVAWVTTASDLAPGVTDGNDTLDVYARDLVTNTTALVSVNLTGAVAGNGVSGYAAGPLLSADGHYCVFASDAGDLASGDGNGRKVDVFRRDLFANTTALVSHVSGGTTSGNDDSGASDGMGVSADAGIVLFVSLATNLAPGDGNGLQDVFVAAPQGVAPPPPPVLSSPATTPTTLSASGGAVTLSVNATSASAVTQVTARITPTGGQPTTVALTLTAGAKYQGVYTAPANSFASALAYQVAFSATNAAGGTAAVSGTGFTVAAPQSPVLTNPRATPAALPKSGGPVTLTVNATGETPLTSVTGFLINPDESTRSVTLTHGSGSTYSGVLTVPANSDETEIGYPVGFSATDSRGLQTSVAGGEVIVAGTAPLEITSCTATPAHVSPVTGSKLTVEAAVRDTAPVLAVRASLRINGTEVSHGSLARAGSVWRGTVTASSNYSGPARRLDVVITAADRLHRSATATCSTTQDAYRMPSFSNCRVSPSPVPGEGATVTCKADLDGAYGVDRVSSKLLIDGVQVSSQVPQLVSGSTYQVTVTVPTNPRISPRTLTFQMIAYDAHTRLPSTTSCPVTQDAYSLPLITNCRLTPDILTEAGGEVTISVDAVDASGIAGVTAVVTPAGGSLVDVPLSVQAGSTYSGKYTAPANHTDDGKLYVVRIRAVGRDGGTVTVDCGSFGVASRPVSAEVIKLHQDEERRAFVAYTRALRAQFRGAPKASRAAVERQIRDVLLDLRERWALETRTRTLLPPYDFPPD